MPEHRRRHDHLRMIAAFENFQVRAARQRRFDAHAHFARSERTLRDLFHAHIFSSIKHCGFHRGDQIRRGVARATHFQ